MTRSYADGSVFWDARRNRWVGIHESGRNAEGKRIRRKVTAQTKTEARRRLRALQQTGTDGRPVPNGSLRLGAYLDRWLVDSVGLRGRSPNTVDNYRWAVDHHIKPTLGGRRLRDLSPDDVDELLRNKASDGLGHHSLMRIRAVLRQALRHAERYGHVGRNVAMVVDLPAAPRKAGRSLSQDQARALLKSAKGERLEAAVVTGLMLGLRPGELLGLCWADVDTKAARLTVQRSLKRESDGLRLGAPKTPSSARKLDLPPSVARALRAHRSRQSAERLSAGSLWADQDLVFASEVGTPIDPSNLRRTLARITKHAGLGHWHPHELRHSAASLLSAAGVSMEQIADLLGHSNARTTAAVYRHRIGDSVHGAAGPMESLLGSGRQKRERQ